MTCRDAAVVVALLATIVGQPATTKSERRARFHHLHYAVDDPAAQLRPAADALQGSRAIVPGLGVGVRVDREYLLFARSGDLANASRRPVASAADAYELAVRWLKGKGFTVAPETFASTSLARSLPAEPLDHVAFAVDDLASAVAAIGVKPSTRTESAATFTLPSGAVLEVVHDTDRPDTFWCPMHPDVRSPSASKCPLCGMALVPIPPLRPGEYRLDVRLLARPGGGAAKIELGVRDPSSGELISSFVDVHQRPFHLFVISRDLEQFAHVHPAPTSDGTFELQQDLAPGMYLLVADFLPAGGTSQLVQRMVATPGFEGELFSPSPRLTPLPNERVVSGMRIRMNGASRGPRRPATIQFDVTDAATGKPVTDLEPFLGAAGHLLVVDNDLTTAIHGHPEEAVTAGPSVVFAPVLPLAGRYKLWVQFQRKGEVITAPFIIDVPPELR